LEAKKASEDDGVVFNDDDFDYDELLHIPETKETKDVSILIIEKLQKLEEERRKVSTRKREELEAVLEQRRRRARESKEREQKTVEEKVTLEVKKKELEETKKQEEKEEKKKGDKLTKSKELLREGIEMTKLPNETELLGVPKKCLLYVTEEKAGDGSSYWVVRWDSKKKKQSDAQITLKPSQWVLCLGTQTGSFKKKKFEKSFAPMRKLAFSIQTDERILDLVAANEEDHDVWLTVLQALQPKTVKLSN